MTVTRGTTNTNDRGSAADRRRRKAWLLAEHGDGVTCPCWYCLGPVTIATIQVDRIIPGALGGTYARANVRPSCGPCNRRAGHALQAAIRARVPRRTLVRLCRLGLL